MEVTPSSAGWTYSGLRVTDLGDAPVTFETGDEELLVLPLAGSCTVVIPGQKFELAGRASVFDGPSDFAYVPIGTEVTLTGAGRVALPSARATRRFDPRYVPASEVPVEIRGPARPAARSTTSARPTRSSATS
ncbi:hypothetical protein GCM10020001_068210 [Nonomuraea salmonea]